MSIWRNNSSKFTPQASELLSHEFLARFTVSGMCFPMCAVYIHIGVWDYPWIVVDLPGAISSKAIKCLSLLI